MTGAFASKVVLVTGASSGIGAELARQFAAAGARVALVARDLDRLNEVAGECRAAGGNAFVVRADLTVEDECRAMVASTVAHYGALDILVNNAGVRFHGRFDEITDLSIFETVMRVNFHASVWCTSYALPHLKKSRGQIVVISSLQGLVGVPNRSAYAASKHALTGFFDSLRVEIKDFGVSVTSIHPSFVYSEHHSRVISPDGTPLGDRAYKRPASDAMSAEECCRLTLRAVARRDRMVLMTWKGKVGRFLKLISPALIDRMAKAATEKKQ
ncbi:MAG: SDR family oxidoreductase [Phycisphaerae bacterium]|nr:SDR family oxidoreductase [Gemmatimonadaceae bacterium]